MFNEVRIVGKLSNVDFEYNILFLDVDNKTFSFMFDNTIGDVLSENLDKIEGCTVGIVGFLDFVENEQIVKIKNLTYLKK